MTSTLAACALAFAACGGDDDDGRRTETSASTQTQTTAQRGPLEDVEPRAAKPNIVGGDAPLAEFVTRSADDAVNYFEEVFAANGIEYLSAEITVVEKVGEFCGQPFDPEDYPIYNCWGPTTTDIALSGPRLDRLRTSAGDGAVAFLAAYAVAADAIDQIVRSEGTNMPPDDVLAHQTACFVGAWIRNVGDRRLLEAGDEREFALQAIRMVSPTAPKSALGALQDGYDDGIVVCRPASRPATTPTVGASLPRDVPRKAAAPNIKGADGDIESVAKRFSREAIEYFDKVFSQNAKTFRHPEVVVVTSPTETACGSFDPMKQGVFMCFGADGDRLSLGAPYLERARDEAGDAAAVFLIGYALGLSAYDQLTGDRVAKGTAKADEEFIHAAACLAGAWNKWMTQESLLEDGDEQELLRLAEQFIPGQTEEGVSLGQDIVAGGFIKGSRACTEQEANG